MLQLAVIISIFTFASVTAGASEDKMGVPLYIRIFKETKTLELWAQEEGKDTYSLYKIYPICYFSGNLGPKTIEGDKQSPEGFYSVTKNSLNPGSRFHLSFNLGYPNAYDRAQGYTGDYLMVHGGCVSVGCYAMTDPIIEEIYKLVEAALKKGQPSIRVHIYPFELSDKNMKKHKENKWHSFWQMLKPAYDNFEKTRTIPVITVSDKKYVIN